MEGVDEPLEVLVGLDVADVQGERAVQLVALPDALHGFLAGRRGKPIVDGVVDDHDAVGGHIAVAQDVGLGRFRHRQDPLGSPRSRPETGPGIRVRQPVGEVLREHQVDAVVDGHDGSARHERRQHVVRRMEEIDVPGQQPGRHHELLAQRVRLRGLHDRREVGPEAQHGVPVLRPAEEDVLGLLIQARQVLQQVPDIGPDAEVVQLAGVDRDTHQCSSCSDRSRYHRRSCARRDARRQAAPEGGSLPRRRR